MQKLLIATHNPAKLNEFRSLLSDLPFELLSLADLSIKDEPEEDGKTYSENAEKKALFYAKKSNLPALADDGGIEISALKGEPGVKSRRWLGSVASDEELIAHMRKVAAMLPEDNRDARFKLALSLATPFSQVWSVTGEVAGIIAKEPSFRKIKGYPYRSFFYLPKIHKYYFKNELSLEEMKLYNHRFIAVEKMKQILLSTPQIL